MKSARRVLKTLLLGGALALGANAIAAQEYNPTTERAKIDAVLKQEIVTANCAVPHVVMGQGDLEGRIDCEGGKKADFRVGFGTSTMPEDLGAQRVSISVSPGVRTDGAGVAPSIGIKNPAGGNVLLNTGANAPVTIQVDPFTQGATLAKYAQFPNAVHNDALADRRFIEQRFGTRAGGISTLSSIVFDRADAGLNRIYQVGITKSGKNATLEMTVAPDRSSFGYRFLAKDAGLTTLDFGLRSANPDALDTATTIRIDANGQYAPQSRTGVLPGACSPSATTLCLHGGKYEITANWRDFVGNTDQGQATQLSNESGDFWFFNADNNEIIVKVIDGCSFNGRYWVGFRALSNVQFDVAIRATETNQLLTYHNPLGVQPSGDLDIDTIFHCDGTGPASEHLDTQIDLPPPGTPQLEQYNDPSLIGPCLPDGDRAICLQGGRFRIEGNWEKFDGTAGYAHMIKKNDSSAYAWFFSPSNYEGLLKVIDGCDYNGKFWVFIAGLTNVAADVTTTDTWTGDVYRQRNGLGVTFPTNLDINTNLTACGVAAPFSAPVPPAGDVTPMSASTDALKDALTALYGAMTVTTPSGTVPLGIVRPHIGPDRKVDGAVLTGKRIQLDADGRVVYSDFATLDAVLECLPSGSASAYALRMDPYSSTVADLGAEDAVAVSFNGTTVSNVGARYATGSVSGTLGDALKTVCSSPVVASPQQAHHLSVVPRSAWTRSCDNILMNSGCGEYTGMIYSLPDNASMTVHADAKLKNGATLGMDMTDTYNGNDLFHLHLQATDWYTNGGMAGQMSYFPAGEVLDGAGIALIDDTTVVFLLPADGYNFTGYTTHLFQNTPLWTTNPWPFD